MSIEEGKNKKNITDILKSATAENNAVRAESDDKKRTYEHTLFSLATGSDDDYSRQEVKQEVQKSRADVEADKIVSAYSGRKPNEELSSTAELKELLESTSDKSLLPKQTSGGSAKAGELGSMLNDAKMQTAELDAKTQTIPKIKNVNSNTRNSRFTDPIGHIHKRAPIQESMFDLDGGETPPTAETVEIETVKFDSDYAQLSSKIASGEISFTPEPEDDSQTVMAAETADLVAVQPENKHFTPEPVGIVEADDNTDNRDDGSQQADSNSENRGQAFEMMNDKTEGDGEEDFDAVLGRMSSERRRKAKKQSKRKPKEFEYTSRQQTADVRAMLKKAVRISRLKVLACLLFTAGIIFLEAATADSTGRAAFLHQGRYGNLYILIDLQLLFFSALVMLKNIKNGFTAILSWRPNADSLLFVSLIMTTAYSIVMLIVDPTSESLRLYSLPAATACLCRAVADCMCCKKDYHCFCVVARKHKKYAAFEQSGNSPEALEFSRYLSPSSSIYTVKRTDFVSGMFHRINTRTRSEQVLGFVIPVMLIMALVLFGVLAFLGKPLIDAYAAATLLVLISTPLTAFFMVTLPVVRINKIGKQSSSAFIGNSVAEEYADAGVLSFADTEVYPDVKVISVKAYGGFRLDNIIPSLATAFDLIGGPLAPVLKDMVDGSYPTPRYSRLVESASDGVCVAINGSNMYIGKHTYMRRNGIEAPLDTGDTSYEKKNGTVMFVAVGDTIAAKVYLIYNINANFDPLLRDMYRAGLCLGVLTLDPNISQEMLKRDIRYKKCPITVIKSSRFGESSEEVATVDSGIVTNGSLHTFLKMFALCDKARHVIRSNIVITMASIFMSFAAVCFFALTASVFDLTSVYALLFQLVWLIPVLVLTLFL